MPCVKHAKRALALSCSETRRSRSETKDTSSHAREQVAHRVAKLRKARGTFVRRAFRKSERPYAGDALFLFPRVSLFLLLTPCPETQMKGKTRVVPRLGRALSREDMAIGRVRKRYAVPHFRSCRPHQLAERRRYRCSYIAATDFDCRSY